jgi:hypothetical protein
MRSSAALLLFGVAIALGAPCAALAQGVRLHLLMQGLAPDASCSQERVLGQCYCGPVPCGLRVQRYVPVALVETTAFPGDSLLAPGLIRAPAGFATLSSSLSATDHTAETHVWTLPDFSLPVPPCLTCGASTAAAPPAVDQQAGAAAACGPTALVA